ncbi:MAG: gas vesicle protein [Myxococcales bacterium]|jgi:hypothetical protein
MPASERSLGEHISLAEVLDRVLGKGAVIAGEVVIAVADIDLVQLELQVALGTSDALAPATGTPASEAERR